MKRGLVLTLVLVLFILCSSYALADNQTNQSNSSSIRVTIPSNTAAPSQEISVLSQKITALESRLATLTTEVSALKSRQGPSSSDILTIKNDISILRSEVAKVQGDLQQALGSLNNQVDTKLSVVSTGLAGLQREINTTQANLSTVEKDLKDRTSLTRILSIIIFVLVLVGAAIIAIRYTTGARKNPKLNPDIIEYITSHIQQGNKFPQIKEGLLEAGWSDGEIEWAYKATSKHNYKKFKKKNPGSKKSLDLSNISQNPRAMAFIVAGAVLILLLFLFFLRGASTGQAYLSYGGVEDFEDSASKRKPDLCFPPQIETKDAQGKTTCCDDLNNNSVCDSKENFQAKKKAPVACSQNSNCTQGRSCVSGECKFISELYNTSLSCPLKCNVQWVELTTLHQNYPSLKSESYKLTSGHGSYTGAGALEWEILANPDYCQVPNTQVSIPIMITKKDKAKVLSKEVIALKAGEISTELTHPTINLYGYKIRVDKVQHNCGPPRVR